MGPYESSKLRETCGVLFCVLVTFPGFAGAQSEWKKAKDRANGLTRVNSPAAMGKLYEMITDLNLSAVTLSAEKKVPQSRESNVFYLGE